MIFMVAASLNKKCFIPEFTQGMKHCDTPRFHPTCAARPAGQGTAPLAAAVTGRTRRGFAPALGGGKGGVCVWPLAPHGGAPRGGVLSKRCAAPRLSASQLSTG